MTCSFEGCDRPRYGHGLCNGHWQQRRRGVPLSTFRPPRGVCKITGCGQQHSAQGYCLWHIRFLYRYGIPPERYEEMLKEQNGVCAVCDLPEKEIDRRTGLIRALSVDHDHSCCPGKKSCGKCVRRLVCGDCNHGLGYFHDDPDRLIAAAMYLVQYQDLLGVSSTLVPPSEPDPGSAPYAGAPHALRRS